MVTQIQVKNGKLVGGEAALNKLIAGLFDGIHTIKSQYNGKPKNIAECRKYYFFLCEVLEQEGVTGYTKKELHELFKNEILRGMSGLSSVYSDNFMSHVDFSQSPHVINFSTKMLNLEGWYCYTDLVKEYVKNTMGFLI